jgi:hypothetical protein
VVESLIGSPVNPVRSWVRAPLEANFSGIPDGSCGKYRANFIQII